VEANHSRETEKETARLEAFSDGVFAIAITLLALNLQVPHIENIGGKWALAEALGRQWPSYVAFVTSFFTILVVWVNHHGVFKLVHKASAGLLFANGFLLMTTTACHFPREFFRNISVNPARTSLARSMAEHLC
jgi:uncharacterized membrane protein